MKKSSIFAAVSTPTKLDIYSDMDFLCPFDCLYLQRYKAVSNPMLAMSYIGRSFVGAKLGGETAFLILFTLIFHSTMPTKMKDYSGAKQSNAAVTPDCESVNPSEKQFDFSKLNEFFSDVMCPESCAKLLREIHSYYIESSIYALMDYAGMKPLSIAPPEDLQDQIYLLKQLIDLIKSVDKNL
jgi:hypothetical protein